MGGQPIEPAKRAANIIEVLGPLMGAAPRSEQPILAALAERIAARRYRQWAASATDPEDRSALLACAAREEEIAERVEALHPRADAVQRAFSTQHPDLEAQYATIFAVASLPEQFAIQAQAERTGAATWRAYARTESDAARARVLESCAALEEESATVLEALAARG